MGDDSGYAKRYRLPESEKERNLQSVRSRLENSTDRRRCGFGKTIPPFPLLVVGICLVLGGFTYDLVFAGIPYQDPTPEMSASYDLQSHIALAIVVAGLGSIGVGSVVGIARLVSRRRRRKPSL